MQSWRRPGCPYCSALRRDLSWRGVPSRWHNIWDDQAAREFVRSANFGSETVPTVRIGSATLTNPRGMQVAALVTGDSGDVSVGLDVAAVAAWCLPACYDSDHSHSRSWCGDRLGTRGGLPGNVQRRRRLHPRWDHHRSHAPGAAPSRSRPRACRWRDPVTRLSCTAPDRFIGKPKEHQGHDSLLRRSPRQAPGPSPSNLLL